METKKTKIINATPHAIDIVDSRGNVIKTYAPSGTIFRLAEKRKHVGTIDGVEVVRKAFEPVEFPPIQEGVYYIVSMVTAQVSGRPDFIFPADVLRDKDGRIIGTLNFGTFSTRAAIEIKKKENEIH